MLRNLCPSPPIRRDFDNASVARLHGPVCPSAVSRLVTKIIVQPFNSQIRLVPRSARPVFELSKGFPLFADGYSFGSVIFLFCISATGKHIFPAVMQLGPCHAMGRCAGLKRSSRTGAAARQAFARSQVCSSNRFFRPACARTEPQSHASWGIAGLFDYCPKPKSFGCHVYQSRVFCHA